MEQVSDDVKKGGLDTALRTPDDQTTVEKVHVPATQLYIKSIPTNVAKSALLKVSLSSSIT